MKTLHKSKGITLIALVVTIIVLLILAGVSINMISGGNGILSKAVKAVDETKRASAQEEVELAWITCTSGFYLNYESSLSKNDYFKTNLKNCVSGKGKIIDALTSDASKKTEINIPGTSYIAYEYDKSEYYFEIDENGKIKNTTVANSGNNSSKEKDPEWDEESDDPILDENPDPDEQRVSESELEKYPEISSTDSDSDGITNYKITYVEDLVQLSQNVANGMTYEGKTITMTRKLDVADRTYYKEPDKTVQDYGFSGFLYGNPSVSIFVKLNDEKSFNDIGDDSNTFKGTFNGNKYAIENLISGVHSDSGSLFYSLTDAGIKNLKIKNSTFNHGGMNSVFAYQAYGDVKIINCKSVNNNVGPSGLASGIIWNGNDSSEIIIKKCYNSSTVNGYGNSAGLIGQTSGDLQIINSYNKGNVTGTSNAGLVGKSSGDLIITKSYNTGKIESSSQCAGIICEYNKKNGLIKINNSYNSGEVTAGFKGAGICSYLENAYSESIIYKCYNTGNISSTGNTHVGGLIAYSNSVNIDECYNTGIIYGYNGYTGGIVGDNEGGSYGNITNCYNTGKVTSNSSQAGGIAGFSRENALVKNCYNTGEIEAKSETAGGVVAAGYGKFENCYNTGNVLAASNKVGGIVGSGQSCEYILNCYNIGDVTSTSGSYVGGISGENGNHIYNSFNAGKINGNSNVGGISGYVGWNGNIINCFNYGMIKEGNQDDPTLYAAIHGYSGAETINDYYLYGTAKYGLWQYSTESVGYPDEEGKVESRTETQFKDGTVLNLLNKYIDDNSSTTTGWVKWKQGENYPVLDF